MTLKTNIVIPLYESFSGSKYIMWNKRNEYIRGLIASRHHVWSKWVPIKKKLPLVKWWAGKQFSAILLLKPLLTPTDSPRPEFPKRWLYQNFSKGSWASRLLSCDLEDVLQVQCVSLYAQLALQPCWMITVAQPFYSVSIFSLELGPFPLLG